MALSMASCNNDELATSTLPIPADITAVVTLPSVAITSSIVPSSMPTSQPLAAMVNGWPITLIEYEAELALYQMLQTANGSDLTTDAEQQVLDELINQALLAQAAQQAGYTVDDITLEEHINQLVVQLGSAQALADWIDTNGYNDYSFRLSLKRAIAATWMRDQITRDIPEMTEQIHARQILLYNSKDAESVLSQLRSGTDFVTLAQQYDPLNGGDLGWFPQGYLPVPELDEPVFALQPGQFTDIISSSLGYHIVQVIERDAQRALSANVRLILQEKALLNWIVEKRDQSTIEILVP